MRKELNYFEIDGMYGGNQELFQDLWMNAGGCAAVTACDVCIYCDLYKGTELYPLNVRNLNWRDYENFGMIMKPYIRPRKGGVDKLFMYTEGFNSYLADTGCSMLSVEELDGHESCETAFERVRSQIDDGMPVAYLNLEHDNEALKYFFWHWFLITGYDDSHEEFKVKVVSYGGSEWLDFRVLWNSGYEEKGGMILFKVNHESRGSACMGHAKQCLEEDRYEKLPDTNCLKEDLQMTVERAAVFDGDDEDGLYEFCLRLVIQDLISADEEDIEDAVQSEELRAMLRKTKKMLQHPEDEEEQLALVAEMINHISLIVGNLKQ